MILPHRFEPADNRRLAHLCGPLDEHLRSIESTLGVKLSRRAEAFSIEGPRAQAAQALALLKALHARAARPISAQALQMALAEAQAQAQVQTAAPAAEDAAAPVLHTRHAGLTGRTPNQLAYLRQMLANDIAFGIGPAGTGTTFLAVACAVDALERHGVQRIVEAYESAAPTLPAVAAPRGGASP